MMDAHIRDFGNVTRGSDVAFEVPDYLVGIREPFREKAAAVLGGGSAVKATTHAREGAGVLLITGVDLKDVDDKQVTRLCALDVKRPGENMHSWKRGIPNVLCRIIVANGTVKPLTYIRSE